MEQPNSVKTYTVSGLTYTMPKLIMTMGIILVGLFAYAMTISVVPRIMPLKLKELGVSSTLMVFIMSTMGSVLNMTVCPWVSFKSDRYRSKRWGRRVPFILYTLPFLCMSWVIMALYKMEAELLKNIFAPVLQLPPATWAVVVLAIGVFFFKFFYMFVGAVIHYVYNDVIPTQFLTRFMGAVQISNAATTALFNFFVFKHALTHFSEIMLASVVVYTLGMGFMCVTLKEPRFPEPDSNEKRQSKGLRAVLTFMRESFSHPFYWFEFLATASIGIAGGTSIFVVFFEQSMGLSLAQIGEKAGWSGLGVMIAAFAIASIGSIFIDRWHPLRVSVFMLLFGMIAMVYECKWFFFSPGAQVFWWSSLLVGQVTFLLRFRALANMPALMRIFPKSRFGQFCSARSLLSSVLALVFGLVLGGVIDFLKIKLDMGENAYRCIYFWQAFFYGTAAFCYLMVYRYFRKLGGYSGYSAPAPWSDLGVEKMEPSPVVAPSTRYLRIALYCFDFACGGTIIMTLVWSAYAQHINAAAEVNSYLTRALPAALTAGAYYLFIRHKITSRIKMAATDAAVVLPHHGILILAMLVRVLLLGALGVQAFLTIKPESGGIAGRMGMFESFVDIIYISMIWVFVKLECSSVTPDKLLQQTHFNKTQEENVL